MFYANMGGSVSLYRGQRPRPVNNEHRKPVDQSQAEKCLVSTENGFILPLEQDSDETKVLAVDGTITSTTTHIHSTTQLPEVLSNDWTRVPSSVDPADWVPY